MKKHIFLITAVLMVTFLISAPAYAGSTSEEAAAFLIEVGENEMEAGDLSSAIHEFSKALMIDPDNKKAQFYLKQYNISEGIYSRPRTPTEQMGAMAHSIKDKRLRIRELEEQRLALEDRVDLLEDAIERKGDHQLLKEIEDYYRHAAFYDIDPNLPYDEQLAALKRKHKEFKEYAFDKDRVQDKTNAVAMDLLGYQEEHLEDARNDVVELKIALAANRKELLYTIDRLKKLRKEFDRYAYSSMYNAREVERLHEKIDETQRQILRLISQRQAALDSLKRQAYQIERRI